MLSKPSEVLAVSGTLSEVGILDEVTLGNSIRLQMKTIPYDVLTSET